MPYDLTLHFTDAQVIEHWQLIVSRNITARIARHSPEMRRWFSLHRSAKQNRENASARLTELTADRRHSHEEAK